MRIFGGELGKLLRRRSFLTALVIFLGANALLMVTDNRGAWYEKAECRQVYAKLETLSKEEKKSYIRESYEELRIRTSSEEDTNLYATYLLFEELYEQVCTLDNYQEYLEDIQGRAASGESISIFQSQDEYSMRSARKTARAFEGLEALEMELNNSHMIKQATEFVPSDLLILLLVFLAVFLLLVEEKTGGMFFLLRPLKHGRGRLMLAKMGALSVVIFLIVAAFFTENYLISGLQYGFADLGLPIQTISGYSGSALHLTTGQYLLLYLGTRAAAVLLAGLLFLLFSLKAKTIPSYYIMIAVFFGLSWLLYQVIPAESGLEVLKYVNLVPFLRVTGIYRYYFHLNILGNPVGMPTVFWAACIPGLLVLAFLLLLYFSGQEGPAFLERKGKQKKPADFRIHVSLLYHEAYKILITNRALLILLLFAGVQFYSFSQQSAYLPFDEYYYREYMLALEGPLDETRLGQIEKEEERYRKLDEVLGEALEKLEAGEITRREFQKTGDLVREQTKGRNAFERVKERRDYLLQLQKQEKESPDFVYEGGWNSLFGRGSSLYKKDTLEAAWLLIVMIASFAGVFSMEFSTGMITLQSCSRQGRMHTVGRKALICMGIATVIFAFAYLPDLINVVRIYGLGQGNSSIRCIPGLAAFPVNLTIRTYLLILFAERYLAMCCALGILFGLSLGGKTILSAMLPPLFLLVLPLLVDFLGIEEIRRVSLNFFFTGNGYLDSIQKNWQNAFWILVPIFLGGSGWAGIRKTFG